MLLAPIMIHRYRLALLLPLLAAVAALATATRAMATESFRATHVAALFAPDGRNNLRNKFGIFRLDRLARTLEYRVTFGGTAEMVVDLRLVRRLPDRLGVPDRVLRAAPVGLQAGTLTGTLNGLTDEEIAAIDSNVALFLFTSQSQPEGVAEGILEAIPNALASSISGAGEIPSVSTNGDGNGTFVLDRSRRSARYFIHWTELSAPATGIQLRRGHVGEAGVTIKELTAPLGIDGDCIGEWTGMSDDEMAALANGELFINIYTSAHPAGEIRGRLDPVETYTAAIEPENVVTPPTGATATGTGVFLLQTGAEGVPIASAFVAIALPRQQITGAHVHRGAIGENGGVFGGLTDVGDGLLLFPEEVMSDPTDLATLRASGMYVDVHGTTYPAGEARGQLIPAASLLSGPAGVPALAAPAVADVGYDRAAGTIVYHLPEGATRATLLIQDITGRIALSASRDGERGTVDAGTLTSGSYLVTIITADGARSAARIGIVR